MQAGLTGQTSVHEMIVKNGGGGFCVWCGRVSPEVSVQDWATAMSTINDPSQTRSATVLVYRHCSN